MGKTITLITFKKNGSHDLIMNLGLKKPIEGETYAQRKKYVKKLLDKNGHAKDNYCASWTGPMDYSEALVKLVK